MLSLVAGTLLYTPGRYPAQLSRAEEIGRGYNIWLKREAALRKGRLLSHSDGLSQVLVTVCGGLSIDYWHILLSHP